ncbi:unnamed protein product [Camellia sinensis]
MSTYLSISPLRPMYHRSSSINMPRRHYSYRSVDLSEMEEKQYEKLRQQKLEEALEAKSLRCIINAYHTIPNKISSLHD